MDVSRHRAPYAFALLGNVVENSALVAALVAGRLAFRGTMSIDKPTERPFASGTHYATRDLVDDSFLR